VEIRIPEERAQRFGETILFHSRLFTLSVENRGKINDILYQMSSPCTTRVRTMKIESFRPPLSPCRSGCTKNLDIQLALVKYGQVVDSIGFLLTSYRFFKYD
jgi:hypothetical protein